MNRRINGFLLIVAASSTKPMIWLGRKLVLIDRALERTRAYPCKMIMRAVRIPVLYSNLFFFKLTVFCQQLLILRLQTERRSH